MQIFVISDICQIKSVTGKNISLCSKISPAFVWLVWKWLATITIIYSYLVTVIEEIDSIKKEWRTKE